MSLFPCNGESWIMQNIFATRVTLRVPGHDLVQDIIYDREALLDALEELIS